jgi:hypothetical protein
MERQATRPTDRLKERPSATAAPTAAPPPHLTDTAHPTIAALSLASAFDVIEKGATAQALTAAVPDLLRQCDLPNGYTDPEDPFAEIALTVVCTELDAKRRMTEPLRALLNANQRRF